VNDEVDVVVLKYDPSTERVSLGHKQLVPDPWATVQDRYPVGARMSGKVVSVTDYGAFVELEPGVEGLIHVSEMSWSKRVKHPSKILNVGDTVEAMVLGVDQAARRISLGLKQVESNPWHELAEKYPVGTRIKGKVRNLTEFGAFVEVEDDIDGLIHISDMSWSKRVKHPSEVLKKSDVVEAMVLSIDAENQRLSLGLKQLATETRLHPSTAHRILSVLVANRLVDRIEPGTYRLGIRLLELGNLVKSRLSVRQDALSHMQDLHQELGETINLSIRHDDEVVYIERTSGNNAMMRVVHIIGARAPLHITAVGKIFLAEDGPEKCAEYARRTGLPHGTFACFHHRLMHKRKHTSGDSTTF